jgi:hypothetical protein
MMVALPICGQPVRGALPPAFGSPRDIWGQMKSSDSAFHLSENIPGVRAQPEGAAPPAAPTTGAAA